MQQKSTLIISWNKLIFQKHMQCNSILKINWFSVPNVYCLNIIFILETALQERSGDRNISSASSLCKWWQPPWLAWLKSGARSFFLGSEAQALVLSFTSFLSRRAQSWIVSGAAGTWTGLHRSCSTMCITSALLEHFKNQFKALYIFIFDF